MGISATFSRVFHDQSATPAGGPERAVAAAPGNVTALLERGNMYRINKRVDDARRDWLRILELEPDSPEADAARANIARIDVDTRADVKD